MLIQLIEGQVMYLYRLLKKDGSEQAELIAELLLSGLTKDGVADRVDREFRENGYLRCKLCPAQAQGKIDMVKHIRQFHSEQCPRVIGLKEAVDLFNSWYSVSLDIEGTDTKEGTWTKEGPLRVYRLNDSE